MIDIDKQPPTVSTTDAAKLLRYSSATIRALVSSIPGAYKNGSGWQIPRDALNWFRVNEATGRITCDAPPPETEEK